MKKILYFCLTICIGINLVLPFEVKAANGQLSLSCTPKSTVEDKIISCNVSINADSNVSKVSSQLSYANSLELVSGSGNFNSVNKSSGEIGNIKFRVKQGANPGNANITLNSIKFDDTVIRSSSVTETISINSTNNKLNSLQVSSGTLSPSFNPNVLKYTTTVTGNSVEVRTTLSSSRSSYVPGYGPRQVKLNNGENTALIKVKSESGDVRTYTLVITKKEETKKTETSTKKSNTGTTNNSSSSNNTTSKSTINTLSKLSLGDVSLTPSFNPDVLEYEATTDKEKLELKADLSNSKSSFIDGYGPRTVDIKDNTDIQLKIKSESGDIKTYTIHVNKGTKLKGLSSLTLSEGNITFDPEIKEYDVVINKSLEELEVKAELANKEDKFVENFGPRIVKLTEEKTVILLKIVNKDNEEIVYTINVSKSGDVDGNSLSSLLINGYKINFNKDTLEYTLKIKKESQLQIEANPENPEATVEILNNENLKNGSVIEIHVTSKEGKEKIYKIKIKKENKKLFIFIVLGIFFLFILIVLIVFILRNRKRKKEIEENNTSEEDINLSDMSAIQEFNNNDFSVQYPQQDNYNQNQQNNLQQESINNVPNQNMNNIQNNNGADDQKVCPNCGTINFKTATKCFMCKKDI